MSINSNTVEKDAITAVAESQESTEVIEEAVPPKVQRTSFNSTFRKSTSSHTSDSSSSTYKKPKNQNSKVVTEEIGVIGSQLKLCLV